MPVVVEQTIPFTPHSLDLENPGRWNKLIPLIRPSVKRQPLAHGQTLLIDIAQCDQKRVHVVVVDHSGTFSSKFLSIPGVTAIVLEEAGSKRVIAEDIAKAFKSDVSLLTLRSAKRRAVELKADNLIGAEVDGDLELDHVLHLLGRVDRDVISSIDRVAELLKVFFAKTSTTSSTFHTETADSNLVIAHVDGRVAYSQAKHALERDLKTALAPHFGEEGSATYSIHYSDVNGLSKLECYILGDEIARFLDSQSIAYSLSSSSLTRHGNLARGYAISVCPVSQSMLTPQPATSNPLSDEVMSSPTMTMSLHSSKMSFDDAKVRVRIESGCSAVIAEEPTITKYDEIVGDGDCGYTLRDGAKQVLRSIKDKDLSALPQAVSDLVNELEVNMGGTSGALYCIFLAAFSGALATERTMAAALDSALQQLLKYTRARLGDRTMLDCLIPFVEELVKTGDAAQAIAAASDGVSRTKDLKASLGRSTYLDENATKGVPDPGAYGLLVLLQGICD